MRALTLTEPWASLVVSGAKSIETRSWGTGYRGPLAIHAAAGFPPEARELCVREPFASALRRVGYGGLALLHPEKALPLGCVIGVAMLDDVHRIDTTSSVAPYWMALADEEPELSFGDYTDGRYAWKLRNARSHHPIKARGMLGLWTPEPHVAAYCQGILDAAARIEL